MTRLINIELTVKWSSLQWLNTFRLRCRRPFYGGSYPGGGIYAGERRCLFTTYDLVRNTWSPLLAAEGTDHDYFPLEAIAAFCSLSLLSGVDLGVHQGPWHLSMYCICVSSLRDLVVRLSYG